MRRIAAISSKRGGIFCVDTTSSGFIEIDFCLGLEGINRT